MAPVRKVVTIHYLDERGRQVKKGTPGAKKVRVESRKYYIHWNENGREKRMAAYEDYEASEELRMQKVREVARGEVGLIDTRKKHLDKPARKHLEEYFEELAMVRERPPRYFTDKEQIIKRAFVQCNIVLLRDLTPDAASKYMKSLGDRAPNTICKHFNTLNQFAKWLLRKDRIPANFMSQILPPQGGVKTECRSLTIEEIQLLLEATRQRALNEALTVRYGPRKGQLVARVRPEVQEQLRQLGRERCLFYKTALLTGLRRGELRSIKVGYINMNALPCATLDMPGKTTKNRKEARQLLVPTLAEELRAWIADTGRGPNDLLFTIPKQVNVIFQRDIRAAGIPTENIRGGKTLFRSLRKSANVLLRMEGIPVTMRKLFMRHSDIRLTVDTYDDGTLEDMAEELMPVLEKIGQRLAR